MYVLQINNGFNIDDGKIVEDEDAIRTSPKFLIMHDDLILNGNELFASHALSWRQELRQWYSLTDNFRNATIFEASKDLDPKKYSLAFKSFVDLLKLDSRANDIFLNSKKEILPRDVFTRMKIFFNKNNQIIYAHKDEDVGQINSKTKNFLLKLKNIKTNGIKKEKINNQSINSENNENNRIKLNQNNLIKNNLNNFDDDIEFTHYYYENNDIEKFRAAMQFNIEKNINKYIKNGDLDELDKAYNYLKEWINIEKNNH